MISALTPKRLLQAMVAITAFVAPATCAHGQSMSLSVYTDAGVNGSGVITVWSSAEDNSWGCEHGGYNTTAHIVSPTGRHASSGGGGLEASTELSIDDDLGWYNLYTTGSYDCSCTQAPLGFSGGWDALAEGNTSQAFFGFRFQTPYTPSTTRCYYAVCTQVTCSGATYDEVISSAATCPPGLSIEFTYKRFLGIVWACGELSHSHTVDYPC